MEKVELIYGDEQRMMKAGLSLGTEHGHRLASHAESGSCDCPEATTETDRGQYGVRCRERLIIMRAIFHDPVSRRLFCHG